MVSIKIKSQNVRGLVDNKKRRQIFHYFNKSDYHIYLLQEAHCDEKSEHQWKAEWGGDIFFCHGTRESRGVCILIKNSITKIIHNVIKDNEGRYIILDIEVDDIRFTLATVYGPNNDDPNFFTDFIEKIENLENDNRIIGGDWNFVMSLHKDKKGGQLHTNDQAQNIVKLWMDETDLVDIWRHSHPDDFKFSWKRRNPAPGIYCRLDFFLVSFGIVDRIDLSDIVPGFMSDHSAPVISLSTLVNKRGRGFWKLNCSHLNDEDYRNLIRDTITDTVNNNQGSNPQLLWDTVKCQIRGVSIQFSARKKKSKENLIKIFEKRIYDLEQRNDTYNDMDIEEQLRETKAEFNKLIEEKTKGAMIRSKATWCEEGERPTKYFLNLEKRNSNNKTISKLLLDNGSIITNTEDIINAQKEFYNKLYTTSLQDDTAENFENFTRNLEIPALNNDQNIQLDQPISEQEVYNALKLSPTGKTPGSDGLPNEFYQTFWEDLKPYLIGSMQYSLNEGRLSITQRQGIICLIPKKDKDPKILKNWRPLSLLNTDYKLISKVLSMRIKKVLQDLISTDQTGAVPGRYIGENIIHLLNIIEYAEEEQIPALLIAVDYEKAFDCIEWSYIDAVLAKFNFGEQIRKWTLTLYKDIESCVCNNGWSSNFFGLSRGVRQGCPLSPYLFVLCVEIMAIAIRSDPQIRGIDINGSTEKIKQFMDDTTLTVLFDNQSLNKIFDIFGQFQLLSGLKVNYDKTEILRIGSLKDSIARIYTQKPLNWTADPVMILGITIALDNDSLMKLNFEASIEKIKLLTNIWQTRDLTWIGKITIIKTLLVSQLLYKFAVLPTPEYKTLKEIDTILMEFLWSKGKHFVSKNTICSTLANGGLNMINISHKEISIKCNWVKRLSDNSVCAWKNMTKLIIPGDGLSFWEGNLNLNDCELLLKRKCSFWSSVAKSWSLYNFNIPRDIQGIMNQSIWFNSFLKINKKPVFYKPFYDRGITKIFHLVDDDGHLLDYYALVQKYNIDGNHLMFYNSIRSAIPQWWKVEIQNHIQNYPTHEVHLSNLDKVKASDKASKLVYEKLIESNDSSTLDKLRAKWNEDLGIELNNDDIACAFKACYSSTISPKLRVFQFRMVHRNIVTNKNLYDWKIKDTNLCTFCNEEVETHIHLFWECTFTAQIWDRLFNWINHVSQTNINFTLKQIMLGIEDPNNFSVYNTIFIITKQFLYSSRCYEEIPIFEKLQVKIKEMYQVEKYIASKRNKLNFHNQKWDSFRNM